VYLLSFSQTKAFNRSALDFQGKTTLAGEIASDKIPFLTLDDANVLRSAIDDPVGFVRGLDRAVIDEIQRAPDLLLAIKSLVDNDKTPGRFLLTGSANLMTIPPEALGRTRWSRKQDWYHGYLDAIVQRDVKDVAQIEQLAIMPKLMSVLAEHSGQLVNYSGIGASLDLNHVTTQKYVNVFESLYLVHTLQPWFTNRLKRLTKSPKLHFLDAGLLAAMRDVSPDLVRKNRTSFGSILETFVFSELRKIATWSEQSCSFSHFRDKEKNEVDIVLENRRGEVIGIEVKSSATVSAGDFSGMRKLATACGDKFIQGMVLYDHDQVVPFGEHMFAAPLSCLWGGSKFS